MPVDASQVKKMMLNQTYLVGTGIQDMTGPIAGLFMFGYVDLTQKNVGLQSRMYARAFIIVDPTTGEKVCLVTTDIGQQTQLMKAAVVERLDEIYPGEFTDSNLIISASHTHSSVSGIDNSFVYTVIVFGANQENFNVVRDGIIGAIQKAYAKLSPGTVHLNQGNLRDLTQNRARPAYLNNPPEEREFYGDTVDTEMTVMRLQSDTLGDIGHLNWFAVHATVMKKTNILMSSDNKGYSSYLFEKTKTPGGQFRPDDDDAYVAGFVAANGGDVSGNVGGPEFQLQGEMKGPAFHPVPNPDYHKTFTESTKYNGQRQAEKGLNLHEEAVSRPTSGSVRSIKANVNMAELTCPPAQGYAMAAGCTDGASNIPGIYQGQLESNPAWDRITSIVHGEISEQTRACHAPKPIFIAIGEPRWGIPMSPEILPLQIVKVGRLAIIAFPGEITTMAGRRLKKTVKDILADEIDYVVITAYANGFNSYTTTFEEYQIQYYEGGHNLLGPRSLEVYQSEYARLATALKNNDSVPPGPPDADFQYNPIPYILPDDTPLDGTNFGDLVLAPRSAYRPGDVVRCDFSGSHPGHDQRISKPYQTVTRNGQLISADRDWDTHFHWTRVGSSQSQIALQWFIPTDALSGTYQMNYFGDAKIEGNATLLPIQGSCTFQVDPNAPIVEPDEDPNVLEFPQLVDEKKEKNDFIVDPKKAGAANARAWIERIDRKSVV